MVDRVSGARPSSVPAGGASGRSADGAGNADAAQNMTDLAKTRRAAQAQTKTVKAQNENLGTVIDIKA